MIEVLGLNMELHKMHEVVITQSAQGDLHNIYNYVLNEWGESVAEKVYIQIGRDIEWLQLTWGESLRMWVSYLVNKS